MAGASPSEHPDQPSGGSTDLHTVTYPPSRPVTHDSPLARLASCFPAAFRALGIDVGGTKTTAGVVEFPSGRVLAERSIATQPSRGGRAVLEDVALLAEGLLAQAPRDREPVAAVGVGICELVAPSGKLLSGSCIRWDEAEVRARLAPIAPVTLEADVRAAALAEALFGDGRPFRVFLYVTIGTGIASCLVLDGVPYAGARGATGTMASGVVAVACRRCGHINRETLEQVASGPALVEHYNRRRPDKAVFAQDVLAAANEGDADALRVIRTAGEFIGSTIGLLVNVLDPEAVIIGGGLGLSKGLFWDSLIASTRDHVWSEVHRDLPILRAATGVRAGFIGAAAAAWQAQGRLNEIAR